MKYMALFTVPGEPVGKGRPKFSTAGGFAKAYTPKKTATYENLVKLSFTEQCGETHMLEGPLIVIIDAYYSIPKSVSKKKARLMKEGEILPEKKPDCDNIAKVILDALNTIAYKDDAQVTSLTVHKHYENDETPPCVKVFIRERMKYE